jgi:hypothetical protein
MKIHQHISQLLAVAALDLLAVEVLSMVAVAAAALVVPVLHAEMDL